MPEKNLITVICTANVCRSPMGAALLKHAIDAEPDPIKSIEVVSAGVSAFNGDAASVNSIKAAKNVGLDIAEHKSQALTQAMIDTSFAVLCMTESHRMLMEYQFKKTTPHIYLFRELMQPGQDIEIPDPYGMNLVAYETCRDSMVEAIPSILDFLRREYK